MKYRKKPVIVDAVEWTGRNHREMYDFLTGRQYERHIEVQSDHFYIDHSRGEGGLVIKTLEGDMFANIGDYIIKGVAGEYYACKPDIFSRTYESVKGEQK